MRVQYSGLHPALRAAVFQDPRVQQELQSTLMELRQVCGPWGEYAGVEDVAVAVCCIAGMHRSVSFVEEMARRVRGWGWEVDVAASSS
ncbi:hypothetical protein K432DRAFT_142264 [Lepidopterella palustris CBS 459.81]|uniref:RapZ C-terminal domain-containing protein n=1 Tax=Lepidopterella palustris CBS 459.81 TaxID=1314670 RepID=A0A8E2E3G0_9PEZI|nr:hypothetical protein K432DRAFT_142264 [Lepidopterella palustris CBS 459.81]